MATDPDVRVIVGNVDHKLNDRGYIIPVWMPTPKAFTRVTHHVAHSGMGNCTLKVFNNDVPGAANSGNQDTGNIRQRKNKKTHTVSRDLGAGRELQTPGRQSSPRRCGPAPVPEGQDREMAACVRLTANVQQQKSIKTYLPLPHISCATPILLF
jgi:hypothetical protein